MSKDFGKFMANFSFNYCTLYYIITSSYEIMDINHQYFIPLYIIANSSIVRLCYTMMLPGTFPVLPNKKNLETADSFNIIIIIIIKNKEMDLFIRINCQYSFSIIYPAFI